ncbi:MAG: hypothetical protein GY869_06965 [Planctomycetes bacterium]|nr:hypothetical protein [Planctomycetota bacterium]
MIAEFGEPGHGQGGFSGPGDVGVDSTGRVYVADTNNNRIQVFKRAGTPDLTAKYPKAIVVAGGGPYTGNSLWPATQMCANFAYRALTHQGYKKNTIYYISHDADLDLDGNGVLDDVDAAATNANLQSAITTWAAANDTEDLLIYAVDHGGDRTFRMSGTELLYATELDSWLDALQETMTDRVIVVYDACRSGSFLSALAPAPDQERILLSSASSDQQAIFASYGRISFSYIFWTSFFEGNSFYNAFVHASHGVNLTYSQLPQIDVNGNGVGNEREDKTLAEAITVGNETMYAGDIPVIGSVSSNQSLAGEISAQLYAQDVIDADGISRVWAVITPPNHSSASLDDPVLDLPLLDFTRVGGNRYEASYSLFDVVGTYNIAIYATDQKGVMGIPLSTRVTQTIAAQGTTEITPDIQVNGSDDPIFVAEGSPVSISLSMESGDHAMQNADWWILELTPEQTWNYFDLNVLSFTPGIQTTAEGPLVDFPNVQILHLTGLSLGNHVFVFGVETNMNGIPDVDQLFYDTVTVSIYKE